MTIVKQISLFDIQELFEMESSHRFDTIFSTSDVQPIFQFFSKKTLRGAPRECNYGAMIHSAKRYSKLSAKRIFENIRIQHVAQSYGKNYTKNVLQ